jgi:energy-coupling factor transporter ATP-binding protein EcfA2
VLQRVRITNFQSIAEADLALGRFTVLVGPSSTGKSAVLRALRLVFRNASGTGYVRVGTKSTTVEVFQHDPMWSVSVERGSGKSVYTLGGGVPAEFVKCGTSVPDPVAREVDVGDESLSTQHDPPFLLSATGSEIARLFGELTGADVLQRAAVHGQDDARAAKKDIEFALSKIEAANESLAGLEDEVELERRVTAAESLERAARAAVGLRALCDKLALVQARAEGEERPEPPTTEEVEVLHRHYLRIRGLLDSIEKTQNRIFPAERILAESESSWSDSKAHLEQLYTDAKVCEHCPIRD